MNEINALPERTRAVLVSTVNYSSGYRPDMEFISSLARRTGALLFVDGTQSVGALSGVRRFGSDTSTGSA